MKTRLLPRPGRFLVGSAFLLAATACHTATAGDTVDEPGLIVFYGDTAAIEVPDTVARGETFRVSVPTFAGGCTREIARTEVRVDGSLIEVRPYNRRNRAAGVCTLDVLILEHRAEVSLDRSGPATVRVIGEQQGGSSGSSNSPARLERRITVR